MKAVITITKSFDEGKEFSKTWEVGDLEEFLKDEGQYLDKLCNILAEHGNDGDKYTVTYTVEVTK